MHCGQVVAGGGLAVVVAALGLVVVAGCGKNDSGGSPAQNTECPEDRTRCDGTCVDLSTAAAHCGACGAACAAEERCEEGSCACAPEYQRCAGECVAVDSDPAHCGDCGSECEVNDVCSRGVCQGECDVGLESCDRACVDVSVDSAHCGSCEIACGSDQECVAGECRCPTGAELCGTTCAEVASDPLHCGGCGESCAAGQECVAGSCQGTGTGGTGGRGGAGGSGTGGGVPGGSPATGGGGGDGTGATGAGGGATGGAPPIEETCTPSVDLNDTTGATVIGDGSPASCTEAALRAAAEQGGVITFDCGPDPVTIDITETIDLPEDRDTTIDGGGSITLDAGHQTRHFIFEASNWMVTPTRVVLQRLVLRNGKAPTGEYFPPVDGYPECAYGYQEGSGGAIFLRDGVLHVIDCEFYDNEAAMVGPDVGGGAIYALGAAGVVISGSRFVGNRAANGGAVGMLFANPEIYNSVFEDNTAEGTGQNRRVSEEECPAIYEFGHENQAGAGGLAGGVYFDGLNDESHTYVICGSVFRNNRANELAGALFRTPNEGMRRMRIENTLFDGNTATGGGVSFIMQNDLTVRGSTFMNNRSGVLVDGTDVGGWASGLWVHQGTIDLENSTFYDNEISLDGTATLTNATLSGVRLDGTFTITNSILVDTECSGQTGSNNVGWPEAACAGATVANPELGAPADNGGPTPTMLPGDPAAIAGVGVSCPITDQRGQSRPADGCAAGAVEP